MSYGYRTRVRETRYLWDQLTEEEKARPLDWCPVSDELIREQYPGQNVDEKIADMKDGEFASFFAAVMRRYRARKEKRKATARYLRQEGREGQAKEIEEEQRKEDEEVKEIEEEASH